MEKLSDLLTTNTKTLNTSVSDVKNTNTNSKPQIKTLPQVTAIAQKLTDRLHNPSRYELYCKYAWRLSESLIWTNLETAEKGRNPQRYFSYLCELHMV